MNYYIDFEATQGKHEIISVGCISEGGREFYSLVHSSDPVTEWIEQLTGITQEEIDNAPSSAKVFSELYDWCAPEEGIPEFICYGSSDFDFINNTLSEASSFKEAAMLSFLYQNMYDCSDEIKRFFYVNKTISLEKLARHFDDSFGTQTHNALDDARLLKTIYEGMQSGDRGHLEFEEYLDPKRYPDIVRKVVRIQNGNIMEEYRNLKEAVQWIRSQPNDKGSKYTMNADEKIKNAARNNSKYFNYHWRIL